MTQMRALVSGRVQGVCYRAETVAESRRLGLDGFARNLRDGSVEVIARGPITAVQALVRWLHHGPTIARVDQVVVDWDDCSPLSDGFNINY